MRCIKGWLFFGVALVFGVALIGLPARLASGDPPADDVLRVAGRTFDQRGENTASTVPPVDYLRDIRPILSDKCFACHGPDETSREADLRLDRLEDVIASDEYAAIIPGNPADSEVFRRIASSDPDERMPPVDGGKSLTDDEIQLFSRWIEQGAPWEKHWAFTPPKRQKLPAVGESRWPENEIDHFILAKLQERGWRPNEEADKEVLIRRVTFDLTGLPPTLAEINVFLADQSPDAYERVVDRLLESPQYGVHMGRFWLDAARYGDTHGMHFDNYREMWLYRDWIVDAFNRNLPYDQFTIEQLAGDLLPEPTLDQQIATGFCRCHVTTNEGGVIQEEVLMQNVVDRVSTMGEVFLGLTVGCAVCHDHKFDPITQKEFYQLYAFFNSLDGPVLDGNAKDPAPSVRVPNAEQAARLKAIRDEIGEVTAKRNTRQASLDVEFSKWLAERIRIAEAGEVDGQLQFVDGLVIHCNFDDAQGRVVSNLVSGGKPGEIHGDAKQVEGRFGRELLLGSDGYINLGNVASYQDNESFSFGAWVKTSDDALGVILAKTNAALLNKGYELTVENGYVTARLSRRLPGYVVSAVTKNKVLPPNEWHHLFVTYNGTRLASGMVIYVDGEPQPVNVLADSLKSKNGIRHSRPLTIGRRDDGAGFAGGRIDEVRVYNETLAPEAVQGIYLRSHVAKYLAKSAQNRTEPMLEAVRQVFHSVYKDEQITQLALQLEALEKKLQLEEAKLPTTLVYRERNQPLEAFVMLRGQYDQPGEKVERTTPEALPPMGDQLPRNRLGLAKWLVAPEHPLTSRVAVNRFWQQAFGTGLVKTSEDFGNQGSVPSHPQLLDWLAVEFRESGWDVKALMKKIVMSATYRQDSAATPQLVSADPENRLLGRGPRFRLDGEMLRDQALAVSGLLVPKLGGPPVKPPQPDGLWKAVGYAISNTVKYIPDTEHEKIHRRSLYTFYKRTAPPPEMSTFDAPTRESSCVRRERTNTPLQALLLLNDPQYFEAAQELAKRVVQRESGEPAARAALMLRLCTGRHASEAMVRALVRFYEEELAKYEREPELSLKLLGKVAPTEDQPAANRLAAWTVVANLVLNMDEVVTKN